MTPTHTSLSAQRIDQIKADADSYAQNLLGDIETAQSQFLITRRRYAQFGETISDPNLKQSSGVERWSDFLPIRASAFPPSGAFSITIDTYDRTNRASSNPPDCGYTITIRFIVDGTRYTRIYHPKGGDRQRERGWFTESVEGR